MFKRLVKAGLGRVEGRRLASLVLPLFANLAATERERYVAQHLALVPESDRIDLLNSWLAQLGTQARVEMVSRLAESWLAQLETQACLEIVAGLAPEFTHASDPESALLVERIRAQLSENQASLDHLLEVYQNYVLRLSRTDADLTGSRVLELGPGHSLLGGVLLVAWGAAEYCGADPFPIARLDQARVVAFRNRLRQASGLPPHLPALRESRQSMTERIEALITEEGGQIRLDPRVSFVPEDAAALSAKGDRFDIVLSNSVLEHVRDLPGAARECARVLRSGGLALHCIDLRDHRNFDDPRAFLSFSSADWEEELQGTPFDYTNRLRLGAIRTAFTDAGLEIVEEDVFSLLPISPEERDGLAPEFRALSKADLESLGVTYVLRKP